MKQMGLDLTAVDIIVGTLRQSIEQGAIKPGDKLPTLQQMETIYCVSRIVVREAIKVLEGEGLVYSRQGSGIYVTAEPFFTKEQKFESAKYSTREIFELFEAICHYACFSLKGKKDLSELGELQSLNADMYENYAKLSLQDKFMYESSFGIRLVRLSGNALVADLSMMLLKVLTTMDYMLIVDSGLYKEVLEYDRYLIEALLERDSYRACFWGRERNKRSLEAIKRDVRYNDKVHKIFHSVTPKET